jgi:hypothetical protein
LFDPKELLIVHFMFWLAALMDDSTALSPASYACASTCAASGNH